MKYPLQCLALLSIFLLAGCGSGGNGSGSVNGGEPPANQGDSGSHQLVSRVNSDNNNPFVYIAPDSSGNFIYSLVSISKIGAGQKLHSYHVDKKGQLSAVDSLDVDLGQALLPCNYGVGHHYKDRGKPLDSSCFLIGPGGPAAHNLYLMRKDKIQRISLDQGHFGSTSMTQLPSPNNDPI